MSTPNNISTPSDLPPSDSPANNLSTPNNILQLSNNIPTPTNPTQLTVNRVITLTDIFNNITTNPAFNTEIENFLLPIVNNSKMTTADIPQLVLFTMDVVDNMGSFNLSTATLPVLIKMIYEYLVNKYNLFTLEERPVFESMFLASVNLAHSSAIFVLPQPAGPARTLTPDELVS